MSAPKPQPKLIDIVITISGPSLDFLDKWRAVLSPYHIIVVQSSGGAKLSAPSGFDVEVHIVADAQKLAGSDLWAISSTDGLSRSYGVLISKKRFVYLLDENCLVAKDPSGKDIDALQQHLTNLSSPATPFFFNTLYDPYRAGTDFVRGYPFSLREGTATAVSHGLWLNRPDYDIATAMVKPLERNNRYVDAVMTVPKGVLFPMSNINLAFDREAIGPAMYFGLSTADQPSDDMWAGLCTKVICDHLGLGCKSGLPYVWNADKPAAGKSAGSMHKDSKALVWQEELIPFFSQVQLAPESNTAELAYLELSDKVRQQLGPKDPYFAKLADGMVAWIRLWRSSKA